MSYRNDYDAARARLEALEIEHAKLLAENSRLRGSTQTPAVPVENRDLGGVALVCLCAFGSIALALIAFAAAAH
ncbi:MAG TPA: hypothetical protein VL326_32500 [Kofleriaceae bacterium]|jgi:hypothetical protein|nr:hypothetical protein [Kofleriaceae bacterium]